MGRGGLSSGRESHGPRFPENKNVIFTGVCLEVIEKPACLVLADPLADWPEIEFCVMRHVDRQNYCRHDCDDPALHILTSGDGLDAPERIKQVERYDRKKVTRPGWNRGGDYRNEV